MHLRLIGKRERDYITVQQKTTDCRTKHIIIKHVQREGEQTKEKMVSKITFFLENRTCNEAARRNVSTSDVLPRRTENQ
jgi:hypothetical protein